MSRAITRYTTRSHAAAAGIFSFLIISSILVNHSHAASSDQAQDVRAVLLKDVRSIDSSGIPGVLACEGGQSIPLVMGKIGKAEMPVAVAAQYEKGRIIALGHPDFYSDGAFKKADTATFMRNGFRWTMHGQSTVLVFKNKGVIPALQNLLGANVQVIELKDWSQLSPTTGTLVGYAEDIPEKEIENVRSYLKQGGGFMTSAIGWGWMMVSKKSVKGESRFNHLLNPAGLYVADGLLDRTSSAGFDVKAIPLGATVSKPLILQHLRNRIKQVSRKQARHSAQSRRSWMTTTPARLQNVSTPLCSPNQQAKYPPSKIQCAKLILPRASN